jgi:hypothetical protein
MAKEIFGAKTFLDMWIWIRNFLCFKLFCELSRISVANPGCFSIPDPGSQTYQQKRRGGKS